MNKVGHPPKYKQEVIDKAYEYLTTCGREQTKLPKLTEYYRLIDISRQTADDWRDKYPEFKKVCEMIKERQEEILIDDGLYGGKEINPGMAIFLLKAKHNFKDDSEKTDGVTIIFNIRNESKLLGTNESATEADVRTPDLIESRV